MKIAIFGATGMVGSRLVDEAMARGHEVTAVTRNGRAIPGTTAVAMDFTDTPAVEELANASDVVIISIPPDRSRVEPIEVNLHAHQRLIDAVPSARIIVVGGAG
ncbi:MAG: NAD(P)H-binding protein, partial [Propionibacterium sp.]|nr:NAD(P)H-binding protein [Propionibacterium sp.]